MASSETSEDEIHGLDAREARIRYSAFDRTVERIVFQGDGAWVLIARHANVSPPSE